MHRRSPGYPFNTPDRSPPRNTIGADRLQGTAEKVHSDYQTQTASGLYWAVIAFAVLDSRLIGSGRHPALCVQLGGTEPAGTYAPAVLRQSTELTALIRNAAQHCANQPAFSIH